MTKLNQMIDLALAYHEEHKTLKGYAFTVNPRFWEALLDEEKRLQSTDHFYMIMGMPVNIGDLTVPDVILERVKEDTNG
jgi:hypothetical protein